MYNNALPKITETCSQCTCTAHFYHNGLRYCSTHYLVMMNNEYRLVTQ